MFNKKIKNAIKAVVAFAMIIASGTALQKQVWAEGSPKVLTEDQIVTNNIIDNPTTESTFPKFVSNILADGTLPNGSDKTQDSTEGMIWTDKYIEKTDIPGKYIITFYGLGYNYRYVDPDTNKKTEQWMNPLAENTDFVFTEQIPEGFYVETINESENKVLQGLGENVIINDDTHFGVKFYSNEVTPITNNDTLAFKFKVSFNLILSDSTSAGKVYTSNKADVYYTPAKENYYYYSWGVNETKYTISGINWNNSNDGFKGINDLGTWSIPDINNDAFNYTISKDDIKVNGNQVVHDKTISDSTLTSEGINQLNINVRTVGEGEDKVLYLTIEIIYSDGSTRTFQPMDELKNNGGNQKEDIQTGGIDLGEVISKKDPALREKFKSNISNTSQDGLNQLKYPTDNYVEILFKEKKQPGSLVLNKTATWNEDKKNYTIQLEAYSTGTVTVETSTQPLDIVLVLDYSSSMNDKFGNGTRLSALQSAAENFLNKIKVNAEQNDVDHNVAIVTFGKTAKVDKVLQPIEEYDNYTLPSTVISGGTNITDGLIKAENALANSKNKKVVVLFGDGMPEYIYDKSNWYDRKSSDEAVAKAKELKDMGIDIYSIGCFEYADPQKLYGVYGSTSGIPGEINYQWFERSGSTRDSQQGQLEAANRLLNYVSSNYLTAEDDGLGQVSNSSGYYFKIEKNYTRNSEQYYFAATSPDQLENVFDVISETITKPNEDIDAKAIVCDQLSEYFKFSENTNLNVYKVKYSGNNEWSKELEEITNNVSCDFNGKDFTLSGFDFNKNCITEQTESIPAGGYKLVITFDVEPESWFIGGNKVPTNNYENSGIKYKDEFLDHFETPLVDVDINYGVISKNLAIYRGNDEENILDQLIDKNSYITNGVQYYLSEYPNADDFVNIDYEYKIDGVSENDIDTTTLDKTTSISINPIVTPKYDGSDTDDKDTISRNVTNANASIYVLVPQINSTNLEMMVEDTTNLDERLTLEDWYCKDNMYASSGALIIGEEPTLTYYYKSEVQIDNNSFTPNESGEYEFVYDVYNGSILITPDSSFNHNNTDPKISDEHENENQCDFNHFYIKVSEGSITINKKLLNNDDVSLDDGSPVFTFKIEKLDASNNVISTIYRHIELKNNYTENQSIVINGLGSGKYRITELSSLRYQIANNSNMTQEVIISLDENTGNADFVNTRKSDDYFSDNGMIVNKFIIKDGQLTIKRASDSNSDIDE